MTIDHDGERLTCPSIVNSIRQNRASDVHPNLVHHQLREEQVPLEEHRLLVLVHHSRVHQRMRPDEIEDRVGQSFGVVDTGSRPRLGNTAREHWQPGRRGRGLLLELAGEGGLDVRQAERADGGAHQTVRRGGEGAVELRGVAGDLVDALWRFTQGVLRWDNINLLLTYGFR